MWRGDRVRIASIGHVQDIEMKKMRQTARLIAKFVADESGATAIEYGLIGGLIGVVIIGAVELVGTSISGKFNAVSSALGASSSTPSP